MTLRRRSVLSIFGRPTGVVVIRRSSGQSLLEA